MNHESSTSGYIIVTSDEPWSDVWHTQLHYAHQLARKFKVIFLGPPEAWKLNHLFSFSMNEKSVEKNLSVIRYVNFLPAVFGNLALTINDRLNEFLIKRKFFKSQKPNRLLVWHFDRYRSYRMFTSSSATRHIYHVIDPVANLNGDVELSRNSDLIVVTSPRFMDHYLSLSDRVIQIGQGYDPSAVTNTASSREQINKNSILLLGTITDSIDFELLQEIAINFPDKLLLIGPDKIMLPKFRNAFEKLISIPGVRWLGPMPPSDFAQYMHACRVGIITYNLTDANNNMLRSPLKVISYLAFGKCVVSNIDCEIPELTGKAVYFSPGRKEFMQNLEIAFNGKLQFDNAAVKTYLDSIAYDHLLQKIFNTLGEEFPKELIS